YFFEHTDKKHTLVLGNRPSVHDPCPNQQDARCELTGGAAEKEDVITSWDLEQEFRPGKYAITDYNFETPSTDLMVKVDSTVKLGGISKYEVYDYPGEYPDKGQGDGLVKLRMEEEETVHMIGSGESSCRDFTSGYRFNLKNHYRKDVNVAYLLTEV